MTIEKKDIGLLRMLSNTLDNTMVPDAYVHEILKQTEIFHFMMAAKIINHEPIPELKEISEKLDKFMKKGND